MAVERVPKRSTEPRFLEATFVVSPYSILEDVDETATALFGYTRDELIGEHGSMLVPWDDRPSTAAAIDRMRRGEITFQPGRLMHRDGTVLDVQVHSRALPDGRLALIVRARAA